MELRHNQILSRCLSIDLEVDPREAKVFALAAVRRDGRPLQVRFASILPKDQLQQFPSAA